MVHEEIFSKNYYMYQTSVNYYEKADSAIEWSSMIFKYLWSTMEEWNGLKLLDFNASLQIHYNYVTYPSLDG